MRPIDAEAFEEELVDFSFGGISRIYDNPHDKMVARNAVSEVTFLLDCAPTIESKSVTRAHWISASWEEDEEDGIENTYSDEFICSNCKEHLYFPDAIEKEDIGFSFCPYCGAQINKKENDNG